MCRKRQAKAIPNKIYKISEIFQGNRWPKEIAINFHTELMAKYCFVSSKKLKKTNMDLVNWRQLISYAIISLTVEDFKFAPSMHRREKTFLLSNLHAGRMEVSTNGPHSDSHAPLSPENEVNANASQTGLIDFKRIFKNFFTKPNYPKILTL